MKLLQLENKIAGWQELSSLIKNLKTDAYPFKVLGLNNGFKGFFLKEYIKKNEANILLVVPSEKDVDSIIADISILDIDYYVLPAWGALAYSPVSMFRKVKRLISRQYSSRHKGLFSLRFRQFRISIH